PRVTSWQLAHRFLHLGGVDIEAVDDDQFTRPVNEEQLPVEQVAHVSSREPAALPWPPATLRPVAGKQAVAADPDLARLALIRAVTSPDLNAGQWATDMTVPEQFSTQ